MGLKLGSRPGTSVKGNRSEKHIEKGKETRSRRKKVWRMKGTGGNQRDRREQKNLQWVGVGAGEKQT